MSAGRAAGPARMVGTVALLLAAACGDGGPSGPEGPPALEAVPRSGDGQFALPGQTLEAFEVLVRERESGEPAGEVRVEWTVAEGAGGQLSRSAGFTDGAGRARTTLTLGPDPAAYRVRTRFPEAGIEPVEFHARGVRRPRLDGVRGGGPVAPGAEVVLEGRRFVGEPEEVDVLFSGIRGRVRSVDETSLRVVVPSCLNEPRVPVVVGLGSVRTESVTVAVDGRGTPETLLPGDVRRLVDRRALSCVLLAGGGEREYLAVVHSASTAGASIHPYRLVLRTADEAVAAGREARGGVPLPAEGPGRTQALWDARVRALESGAVPGPGAAEAPPAEARRTPEVGDRRRFQVLGRQGELRDVRAEIRHVSRTAIVYVDLEAPEGGFEAGDLESLAREFDDPVHPTVTGTFGRESDLDGNGRVVILFTPVVNRLSEPGSDGFVGGFFYGVDLLPGREGSNEGEIFYALVPDPGGAFGDRRTREEVLTHVPAVLAHEFQHMVHFNQRILRREAERTDALWLNEALATSAEELVADAFAARGRPRKEAAYRSGNHLRARRFLEDPASTSLVVNEGSGTLAERGAGWLFLAHLRDRRDDGILGALTRTTRRGTSNVTAVMGRPWSVLLRPWTAALYLDGLGLDVDGVYLYAERDLRRDLGRGGASYPLRPPVRGRRDATLRADVRSSAAAYTILAPGEGGVAVSLAAADGGALRADAELGLTLVRLR